MERWPPFPLAPVCPAGNTSRMRRLLQTDFLLWAILSVSFFVTRVVIDYRMAKYDSWLGDFLNWADRGFDDFDFNFVGFCFIVMFLFTPMVALAWLVHAVFVQSGVRLTGGKAPIQAQDYRDPPVPNSPPIVDHC
jgi:hypothetical protein